MFAGLALNLPIQSYPPHLQPQPLDVVGLEHPYLPLFVFGVLYCVYVPFWDPCVGVGDLSQ
jgi:hypothetical protein